MLTPSAGHAQVCGRVGALLELGAEFHPECSGLDNVLPAASPLGLTARQIEEKLPSIIEFADIVEHLDQPVRTYSPRCSSGSVRRAYRVRTRHA